MHGLCVHKLPDNAGRFIEAHNRLIIAEAILSEGGKVLIRLLRGVVRGRDDIRVSELVEGWGGEGPSSHLGGLHGRLEEETLFEGVPVQHYYVLAQTGTHGRDCPLLRGTSEGLHVIAVHLLFLKGGEHW
jgi:hypothetical protein